MEPTNIRLTIPDSVDLVVLLGPNDALLRQVERSFDAMVTVRGRQVGVTGPAEEANRVVSVFSHLISRILAGEVPGPADVEQLIGDASGKDAGTPAYGGEVILSHRGRSIAPKTAGQRRYVASIRNNAITFCTGPAGTGKTYLAMAMALHALKGHEIGRIVLARPVVEAGESLGYLPGTLQEKLDPYVRPLLDALFDMSDVERATALIDSGIIEVAPLAFMRGRTFNDAFVILDEAQNTSPDQMKMFLTRLGFGSRFVVTGDVTQRDILGKNGLESAREVLGNLDGISFVDLDQGDIVRHSLVAHIVEAYEHFEARGGGRG